MYLKELVCEKAMLNKKIVELESILHHEATEAVTQALLEAIDLKQSKLLSIYSVNHKSKINIGDSKVDINIAVIIRNTIQQKMDVLTNLINDNSCILDKLGLMEQRDQYNGQLVLLNIGILKNDLSVEIG
mgnify:FL=1